MGRQGTWSSHKCREMVRKIAFGQCAPIGARPGGFGVRLARFLQVLSARRSVASCREGAFAKGQGHGKVTERRRLGDGCVIAALFFLFFTLI